MRYPAIVTTAALCWSFSTGWAASTPFKLVCLSVQVDPAVTDDFGIDYQLAITAAQNEFNGEIRPGDFAHEGWFILQSDIFGGEPIVLPFGLDFFTELPDANNNAYPDFFESDQPFAERIEGGYLDLNNGVQRFITNWTREAGSLDGTVRIALPELGLAFDTEFHLLEYAGAYESTRAGNVLNGTLALASGRDPQDTITGPLSLTVENMQKLAWTTGTWQGAGGVTWNYDSLGERFELSPGEYRGLLAFQDGLPATSAEDYGLWAVWLSAIDANNNQIPDLLDSAAAPRPSLALVRAAQGFSLTITGTAGQTYTLESSGQVHTGWATAQTVTMATDTQSVSIPRDGLQRFFRLKL